MLVFDRMSREYLLMVATLQKNDALSPHAPTNHRHPADIFTSQNHRFLAVQILTQR